MLCNRRTSRVCWPIGEFVWSQRRWSHRRHGSHSKRDQRRRFRRRRDSRFNVARYYSTGTFAVPRGVVLCGAVQGPFDVAGVNPALTTTAPTLLITNTGGPFITLQGIGAGVTDLLFHYPNQVGSSAATTIIVSIRYRNSWARA